MQKVTIAWHVDFDNHAETEGIKFRRNLDDFDGRKSFDLGRVTAANQGN